MQSKPHPHTHFSFRICSSPFLLRSCLGELRKLLLQNGYPAGVANYNINDVLNRQQNRPRNPTTTVPKKERRVATLRDSEKSKKIRFNSRSGKSQGVLFQVREFQQPCRQSQSGKVREFYLKVAANYFRLPLLELKRVLLTQ